MEAENKRIMEFASHQEHMEENRMAKIKEREEAKEHLHKIVGTTFFMPHIFILSFSSTCLYLAPRITPLCSPLAV